MSRSSTETEYRSLALNWIEPVNREMGVKIKLPLRLACDNLGVNYLTRNPIFHTKAKHVAISYHFVREQVATSSLVSEYVRFEEQPVDIFTKPLTTTPFNRIKAKLIDEVPLSL